MTPLGILGLVVTIGICQAEYNPILTLDSCTRNSVLVRVSGAESGGIIYVQGQGSSCKKTTVSRTSTYIFNFKTCNLAWGETFRLVIQRHARYQTGHDRVFPVTCLVDLDDIDLSKGAAVDSNADEALQTISIRPSATMALTMNGRQLGGAPVRLGDVINLELRLDTQYTKDFDIKAESCTASFIDITAAFCAVDPELFPDFTRVSRGVLSATFGAFRTTDLRGGAVRMTFSCTLQVCLGDCPETYCPGGNLGFGKRKRRTTIADTYNDINKAKVYIPRPGNTSNSALTNTILETTTVSVSDIDVNSTDDGYFYDMDGEKDKDENMNVVVNSTNALDSNTTDVDDITVESTLEIAPDDVLVQELKRESKVCLDVGVSISIILFMLVGLVAIVISVWVLTKKALRRKKRDSAPVYYPCTDARCQEDFQDLEDSNSQLDYYPY